MTDRAALARRIMAAGLITTTLDVSAERAELADQLAADGTERVRVTADDGTELGKASYVGGELKAKVVDEAALLTWVRTNHPDQVREIVDTPFRRKLLAVANDTGEPIDPATGEVVPGIEIGRTSGYVRVTPNSAAKERMAELLSTSPLFQLPAPDPAVAPVVVDAPDIAEWPGLDDQAGGDPW